MNAVNGLVFVWKVRAGRIRPHPVTWLLWAIGPYLAFAAQVSVGVTLPALVTLITGLNPTIIFLVALARPGSSWRVSAPDLACGAAAALGLLLWAALHEARLAILFAIVADAVAAVPTFRKSYSHPDTEVWGLYAMLAVSGLITLASMPRLTFADGAFAAYLAVLGITLSLTVLLRGAYLRRSVACE